MDAPPVHYATTSDGYSIAYTVEGSGPAAIWLPSPFHHVLAMRKLSFHAARIAWSAERFRFIQYDQRGQGLSSRGLPSTHAWDDYQQDLDAVIEKVGAESYILIAPHSAAPVAIEYAAWHAQRVPALILFNPDLGIGAERNPAAMANLAEQDWEYFMLAIAHTDAVGGGHAEMLEAFRDSASQADFLLWQKAFLSQDVAAVLPDVTTPTLVFASPADSSAAATPETSRKVAAAIPDAQLVVLNGYPGDARPAVEAFIASLHLSGARDSVNEGLKAALAALSPREREVLRLIALGLTNREIAADLVLSVRTVARHITNLYAKIGVRSKAEATAYAIRQGLS